MRGTLEHRLFSRVTPGPNGCWVWTGSRNPQGYGTTNETVGFKKTKFWRAHRASWHVTYGPIPEGQHVLHRCDNPPCIRPDHLFLGDNADNSADKMAKKRQAYGERQGRAKLTEDQVREIRRLIESGHSVLGLSKKYPVSRWVIRQIKDRLIWKHVV